MNPNRSEPKKSSVTLTIDSLHNHGHAEGTKVETLVVEASIKPYINLVWLGTAMLIIGFFITIFRRSQEAFRNESWK